jgi:hypothetical protein
MVFSGVFFAMTLIIPMLDLPARTKVVGASVSFILMEIIFWAGGLLVGKELFTRYKKRLNPVNWFKTQDRRACNTTEDSHPIHNNHPNEPDPSLPQETTHAKASHK